MKSINDSYVLITGATSGIGYEFAKIFAAHSYNLIIVARNSFKLNDLAEDLSSQYGVSVVPVAKDLFKKYAPFEVYEDIKAKGLKVDILVNNAGQGLYGKFVDTDLRRELDMIQLNVNAYVILTKLFMCDMVRNGYGKILNVASVASKVPGPYQSVYHATKAFVHSFTEAIRAESLETGVTITSLLPGATNTDFFNKADMQDSKILDHDLANPQQVAIDGFNALMDDDDMVVSGLKNKSQVAMSNITPDRYVAKQVMSQQSPRNAH